MQQGFIVVPFSTESGHGITQADGIAKFSPAGVILEYEAKLFGLISNGTKEFRLPLAEVLDVRYRRGVMKVGAKIEIRPNSFAKLADIPHQSGKIVLKIARQDLERAEAAVNALQGAIDQRQATAVTPVISLFDYPPEDPSQTSALTSSQPTPETREL